ncbi:MAG: hypothetical protein LBT05_09875 [Planctomycetaceae bacterium]|jgi:hypothetical protein|nr:hypothetical protein [Planctomycetaceae bacterium]
MTSRIKDLWTNIDFKKEENTSLTLMKRQAELLKKKTNGLLEGKIITFSQDNAIYHTFYIYAPQLDNFRYALLRITSNKTMYPVSVYDYSNDALDSLANFSGSDGYEPPDFIAENYQEFEKELEKILSSNGTQKIITSLVNQSRAAVS